MKNLVRVLSLALVVVMLCVTLASCAGLSGTYMAGTEQLNTTYKFSPFGKVTVTYTMGGANQTSEGKYKVDGDKITFTTEVDGKEVSAEFKFEKTDDGIKIEGLEYKKQ